MGSRDPRVDTYIAKAVPFAKPILTRLGFWKASLLNGKAIQSSAKDAMGQFGRITSVDDLPADKEIVALVRQAARLNDAGIKVVRAPKTPKPMPKAPPAFVKALRSNPEAKAHFDASSPSHRREYLEWIVEAKTDATRDKRIATAIEWLTAGKSRNWKYERS